MTLAGLVAEACELVDEGDVTGCTVEVLVLDPTRDEAFGDIEAKFDVDMEFAVSDAEALNVEAELWGFAEPLMDILLE